MLKSYWALGPKSKITKSNFEDGLLHLRVTQKTLQLSF